MDDSYRGKLARVFHARQCACGGPGDSEHYALADAVIAFHRGLTDVNAQEINNALVWNDRPLGAVLGLLNESEQVDLIVTVRSLLSREAARSAALLAEKDAVIKRLNGRRGPDNEAWEAGRKQGSAEVHAAHRVVTDQFKARAESAEAALVTERAENERLRAIIEGATSPEGIDRAYATFYEKPRGIPIQAALDAHHAEHGCGERWCEDRDRLVCGLAVRAALGET